MKEAGFWLLFGLRECSSSDKRFEILLLFVFHERVKKNDCFSSSRRSFLKSAVMASASCMALGFGSAEVFAARRAKKPRWELSCRDNLLAMIGAKNCWEAMDRLGISGVEASSPRGFQSNNFFSDEKKYDLTNDAGIKELKKDLKAEKKNITAFLMGNTLEQDLAEELKYAETVVNAAEILKVPAIRIDVYPSKSSKEDFLPIAINACKKLCDLVKGTKIRYAIENHGSVTNDPWFLDRLFDGVGSDHLGLTLDTANFYWYGHPLNDIYGIFERYAGKAYHTHCKSIKYPEDKRNSQRERGWEYEKYAAPIDEGDIDFEKFAQIMKASKYKADMCLENEIVGRLKTPEERFAQLKREIDYLARVTSI